MEDLHSTDHQPHVTQSPDKPGQPLSLQQVETWLRESGGILLVEGGTEATRLVDFSEPEQKQE